MSAHSFAPFARATSVGLFVALATPACHAPGERLILDATASPLARSEPDSGDAAASPSLPGDAKPDAAPPPGEPATASLDDSLDAVLAADAHVALCPTQGRLFACGLRAVVSFVDGAFHRDVELERGLPHDAADALAGPVARVVGAWPGDAWLVFAATPGRADLYAWRRDRWVKRSTLGLSWENGVVPRAHGVTAVDALPCSVDLCALGLRTFADALPLVDQGWDVQAVAAVGDTVFGAFRDFQDAVNGDHTLKVMRWKGGRRIPMPERPPVEPSFHWAVTLQAVAEDDVVLYGVGGTNLGRQSRVFARFDGKAWSTVPLTMPVERVRSYAKQPDGVEWLLVDEPVTAQQSLWRRASAGPWEVVLLPGFTQGAWPEEVLAAEGEAWVRAEGACKSYILRTHPTGQVFTP